MNTKTFERQFKDEVVVAASPEQVFAYLDDHRNLSSHMSESSWMMGGGRMDTVIDEGMGQRMGSHIRLSGSAFGVNISLDEVVAEYEPPHHKTWETVGVPQLLVIGNYRMGFIVEPSGQGSLLAVFIEYDHPKTHAWLGRLFGGFYARWCVRQMLVGATRAFNAVQS